MRLAVISDIHGNLTALEAVLADIAGAGVEMTWCLGDLAAFGAQPAECVQRVRALAEADEGRAFRVIGGNTDRYLVNGTRFPGKPAADEDAFSRLYDEWRTRDAVLNWNFAQLTWDDYQFLNKILYHELSHEVDGFGRVIGFHAVPGDDEAFITHDTPDEQALDYLLDREGVLALYGHTHVQMDRQLPGWRLVNPGSVGASRSNPGRAEYALLTFEGGQVSVELRALEYDTQAALDALGGSGHPMPELAARFIRP